MNMGRYKSIMRMCEEKKTKAFWIYICWWWKIKILCIYDNTLCL